MTDNPILTVKEAAELLKVSDKTLYTWVHRADFPAIRLGNCIRIPYGLLMDWVNTQAQHKEV